MAASPMAAPRWRRVLTTSIPIAVPLCMHPIFQVTARRFGPARGYQAGFAIYWATCWGLAAVVAGPRRLAPLWQVRTTSLPDPKSLAWAALLVPPAGAITTQLVPHVRRAGPSAIVTAVGVGTTNALAEEVLWRGLPVTIYPDDPVLGWLLPAVGFTAWHIIPLQEGGAPRGRWTAILLGAACIGLGNGWIAYKTHSLNDVLVSHAITDSCGVESARTRWVRGR
ncbi:CPBP family intramembrane glutamic endopeptidase [Antrihabitans stalactiti]|uniref:CPBP family intramembrane metalloprotease n=1 Tax=Antrihabitans stalactiti TaxID=2584121 RepID=A0A848KRT2_9NOCA|nr:CPBP family intramembrane glutamic endopeptidase [Antrihabitans stalactiti]NMN98297.1 CPBP family intramembrane metalloprotease [Antrihabitans stalactiti]